MKWCLQCGKPNDILNETCEECDNPNFYDPNAKAGDAEIKSLRAERDNLAAANAELTRALHLGVYLLTIPAIQDVMRSQLENDELSPIADFENSAHAVLAKGGET